MSSDEVFYTKYRPKQLSQIIGQDIVIRILKKSCEKESFHHSYLLSGKYGTGKCISADSLVYTVSGLKRIGKIVSRIDGFSDLSEEVFDDSGSEVAFKGFFERDSDINSIETSSGMKIKCTPEHKIKILDNNCDIVWKESRELKVGDYAVIDASCRTRKNTYNRIDYVFNREEYLKRKFGLKYEDSNKYDMVCTNFNEPTFPKSFNCEIARLFGYFISEGSWDDSSIKISNSNPEIIQDISKIVSRNFGYEVSLYRDKRRKDLFSIVISNIVIVDFFRHYGLLYKSKEKCIPDVVFQWDDDLIFAFLRAYFEGDGGVEKGRVACCSISEKLIREIQTLLLTYGILSFVNRKQSCATNTISKRLVKSYSLSIYGNNLKKFENKIGFISIDKIIKLKRLSKHIKGIDYIDTIPYMKEILYEAHRSLQIKKNGVYVISKDKSVRSERFIFNSYKSISRISLLKYLQYFTNMKVKLLEFKKYRKVRKSLEIIDRTINKCLSFCKSQYFFDPIISIENGKEDVYDIAKKSNHSFIANGFVNHNTSVARIIATLLTCENRQTGSYSVCGKCDACISVHSGNSVDIYELDGASNSKVENTRAVIESSRYSPQQFKKKVFIIDECHKLSNTAMTSLLKTLEEPSSSSVFILCTTDFSKVPKEIVSRCQRLHFKPVQSSVISSYLSALFDHKQLKYDQSAIDLIAASSGGSVRDALQLSQSVCVVSDGSITEKTVSEVLGVSGRELMYNLIGAIASKDLIRAIDILETMFSSNVDCRVVCEELESIFRTLMLATISDRFLSDITSTERKLLDSLKGKFDRRHLVSFLAIFEEAEKALSVNINNKWVMEAVIVKLIESIDENN